MVPYPDTLHCWTRTSQQWHPAESGKKIAGWVKDRLWEFHRIDNMAALFRYADPPADGELWIDYHHLQAVSDKLVQAIEQYMATRTNADTRGLV